MNTDREALSLVFSQTCAVYLNHADSDTGHLHWKMEFPNGQKAMLKLSVEPLLAALERAADSGLVPHYISTRMAEMILSTAEHHTVSTTQTMERTELLKITETLPWIDYSEVFANPEERGRAEGRAGRDMEIALKMFERREYGGDLSALTQMLKDLGIADEIIGEAHKQYENRTEHPATESTVLDSQRIHDL